MNYLGIDYGTIWIGLAKADNNLRHADPFMEVRNVSAHDAIDTITQIVKREKITTIVTGIPFHEDGKTSKKAQEIEMFITVLKKACPASVIFATVDEYGTSQEAESLLFPGKARKLTKDEKRKVNSKAAAILLQNYLDHTATNS